LDLSIQDLGGCAPVSAGDQFGVTLLPGRKVAGDGGITGKSFAGFGVVDNVRATSVGLSRKACINDKSKHRTFSSAII
jgi:hypothetical protein